MIEDFLTLLKGWSFNSVTAPLYQVATGTETEIDSLATPGYLVSLLIEVDNPDATVNIRFFDSSNNKLEYSTTPNKLYYNGAVNIVIPFSIYSLRYDTTNNIYVLSFSSSAVFPFFKGFSVSVKAPSTGAVNVKQYQRVAIQISDAVAFESSLRSLFTGYISAPPTTAPTKSFWESFLDELKKLEEAISKKEELESKFR
jgi:hypothetical protein